MKQWFLVVGLFVLLGGSAFAQTYSVETTSGTMSVEIEDFADEPVRVVSISWTADDDGYTTGTLRRLSGTILRVVTNPADGDEAPSDNWGVTLTDRDGIDVFAGKGANRDTADSEAFVPLIGDGATTDQLVTVAGELTLAVSSAGPSKSGVIRIYLQ